MNTRRHRKAASCSPRSSRRPTLARHHRPARGTADRTGIFRDAFMKAMNDPTLLAEAKKQNLEVTPTKHEVGEALVERYQRDVAGCRSMTIRLVSAKVRVFHKCPTPFKVTTIRTIAGNESMYAWTDTNIYNEMGSPTLVWSRWKEVRHPLRANRYRRDIYQRLITS
jgi:hypothetical protein